jgi:TetR/AcrR family transcriptional regulator, mexJK operon transcriptional repressor
LHGQDEHLGPETDSVAVAEGTVQWRMSKTMGRLSASVHGAGGAKRVDAAERRHRILQAAHRLFLLKGYEDTSLNDIIAMCGGSKASIVENFGNKAGLFTTIIESEAISFAGRLKDIPTTVPQTTLQAYGEAILHFYLLPEALLIYRGVISSGAKFPAVSRAFYLRAHEHVVMPVAEQLSRWHEEGKIKKADFHGEADRFTHMLRNGLYEQHLLGFGRKVKPDDVKRQVGGAVRVFLRGLQT